MVALAPGATEKFEVLVTIADAPDFGHSLAPSVSASSFQFFDTGNNIVGQQVNGAQLHIEDGEILAEIQIVTQPGNGAGGTALSVTPVVHLINIFGELMAYDSSTVVEAYLVGGTGTPGAGIVSGELAMAQHGIATFDDLAVDLAGAGYQLRFRVSGLETVSEPFNVEVGPAHALRVHVQPSEGFSGSGFTIPPQVEVVDAGGNRTELDNLTQITASLKEGAGALGAALGGTKTATVSQGVAIWPSLFVSIPGSGYQLEFTADGLAGTESEAFNVSSSIGTAGGGGGGGCSLRLGSGQASGPMPAGILMLVGLLAVVGLARRRKAVV